MLLAVLLSLAIGLVLGLLGGGGSILTLPMLVYALGMETKPAIAMSLLVVGTTAVAALATHARAGKVAWRTGLSFGAVSMSLAFVAGSIAHRFPSSWLLAAFTAVMLVTGVAMVRRRPEAPANGATPSTSRVLLLGAGVGMLTGAVGAGGGFLVVPALMLGGLTTQQAIATSLLVIAMNSFAGLAGHLSHVTFDLGVASAITASAVVGGVLGGLTSGRLSPAFLRRAFGTLVVGMAAWMALRQIPSPTLAEALHNRVLTHTAAALAGAAAYALLRSRRLVTGTRTEHLDPSRMNP